MTENVKETRMYHRHMLDELFGEGFIDGELIPRLVATTENSEEEAKVKLDNCLAYLVARGCQSDPNGSLVCNLGPDEAWHVFILYTDEYTRFCHEYWGVYLHHDPAGEAALVNSEADTNRTVRLFEACGIAYDPELWQDYRKYPKGAGVLPTAVFRL